MRSARAASCASSRSICRPVYYLGAQGSEGLEFELARAYAARLGVTLTMYALDNEEAMQAETRRRPRRYRCASLTDTPDLEPRR